MEYIKKKTPRNKNSKEIKVWTKFNVTTLRIGRRYLKNFFEKKKVLGNFEIWLQLRRTIGLANINILVIEMSTKTFSSSHSDAEFCLN